MLKNHHVAPDELQGENHEDLTFVNSRFLDASLRLTSFTNCTFQDCDFTGVELDMTNFDHCTFLACKLNNLDFSPADFQSCDFTGSLIKNSLFQRFKAGERNRHEKCSLKEAIFTECDLTESGFLTYGFSKGFVLEKE